MRTIFRAVALAAAIAAAWWLLGTEQPSVPAPPTDAPAIGEQTDGLSADVLSADGAPEDNAPIQRRQQPAGMRSVALLDAATRQPLASRRLLVSTNGSQPLPAETSDGGQIQLPNESVSLAPAEGDWFDPLTTTIDASTDSLSLQCYATFQASLSTDSLLTSPAISIQLVAAETITPHAVSEWQRTRKLPTSGDDKTVATAQIGEQVRVPSGAEICAVITCDFPVVVTPSHPAWSGKTSKGAQGRTVIDTGVGTTKGLPVSAPTVATPGGAIRVAITASEARTVTLVSDLPGARSPASVALYSFNPKGPSSLVAKWAEVATWTDERRIPSGGNAHVEGCLPGRYRVTATADHEHGFIVSSKTFEVRAADVRLPLSSGVGAHAVTVEVLPSVGLPPTAQLTWNVLSRPRGVTRGTRLDVYGGLWSGAPRFRITGLSQPTGQIMLRHRGGSEHSGMIAFDTEKTGEVTWR